MKIVYMGTPDFAVGPLEALLTAGHSISAVVTQPDKPKGRGREVQFSPVKRCALAQGILVLQPGRIREPEAVKALRELEADVFVVAAFGQILSQEILELPRYGCLNIHASLLPKYRGAAPIQRAILDGEEKTGVTVMQMDAGLDTGDMLLQRTVNIADTDTGDSLQGKLAAAGSALIVEALEALAAGTLQPVKQDSAASCYAKMLTKEEGRIDWNRPAAEIERLVRGLNSWPGAYTFYQGRNLKIWESGLTGLPCTGPAGTVAAVEKDRFTVNTGTVQLALLRLQLEGKKQMTAGDFLRGCRIQTGDSLGGAAR